MFNFSLLGPYYFIAFFIQIIAISPILLTWIRSNDRKDCVAWHLISVIFLIILSRYFINNTFILPLHGTGRHLLGGTF